MKTSIRSKSFTMGITLFLIIILLLAISSTYYLNNLSGKTNAILKENHYSVVYAQEMSEVLINVNNRIIDCALTKKAPDSIFIKKEFLLFDKSLGSEKNNITENGEDNLVSGIETSYNEFRDCVMNVLKTPDQSVLVIDLQKKFDAIHKQIILLSQMNEKAIEEKTNDAKISARKATTRMTFIAALCFLIAYGFTFSFSSYFNERFYRLYNGIKEISLSDYSQKNFIEGNDELSEISLIFNEMTDEINKYRKKEFVILHEDEYKEYNSKDIQELKSLLIRLKSIEEQAMDMISRIEKK
jgi:two-component system, NtrC family, sensor histidine kinase KinB